MAMNVGSSGGDDEVVSEINTTPLVDVMLVLLIIFLITIPVATTSIKVKLPSQSVEIRQSKPENIVISVSDKNVIHYYDRRVTYDELVTRLKEISSKKTEDKPEVHIRGDQSSNFEGIGYVINACQRAGIQKVAFITEPPARD